MSLLNTAVDDTADMLNQHVFVSELKQVDVQPADGFGVLLPGEERWVDATFSPTSAVSHDSSMLFRTSLGQTTTVR